MSSSLLVVSVGIKADLLWRQPREHYELPGIANEVERVHIPLDLPKLTCSRFRGRLYANGIDSRSISANSEVAAYFHSDSTATHTHIRLILLQPSHSR